MFSEYGYQIGKWISDLIKSARSAFGDPDFSSLSDFFSGSDPLAGSESSENPSDNPYLTLDDLKRVMSDYLKDLGSIPENTLKPSDGIPGASGEGDYPFREYLEGLFSSTGAENEENRKFNSAQAALNREFQSAEAKIQRDWYEAMSNSAYTRAVSDMKNAGINPILAYSQGGAASAGTGIASGSAASYQVGGGETATDVISAVADLIGSIKKII